MDLKERVIAGMKKVFGEDTPRINHALKVLNFCEEIAGGEKLDAHIFNIVVLTGILHDIGIQEAERKYGSNSGKYQEIEGPSIARRIMEREEVDEQTIERVCYIVGGHHTYSKNNGIDFQVVWEADLLVNIEEGGLNKGSVDLKPVINENFRTPTGKKIAEKLYL